ncbi:ATP-dependent DNA helicase RecG [Terrilactibacillus sp. BCM23-1]|uniref:ATP-dependent DNA helicase RecG n=1 Tax=Terrilactibacillus tamarindi TaxID=2599694 RepID=A0A6N8CQL1_9BACI|nr:ATP-dependent DNA helicase RecG [Terrilactibacillus tamarindi]MTT32311.1 ATP-dependent DNA helicase RecG [Terrilactibacillus tamarindi]
MTRQVMKSQTSVIQGVGESLSEELHQMKLNTVEDVLHYFPYRYNHYELKDLSEAVHDEMITIEGKVQNEPLIRFFSRKKSRLTAKLLVGRYLITIVAFNRPFLKNQLKLGEQVTITGKWDQHRGSLTILELHKGPMPDSSRIEPVYAVKGRVTVKKMRRIIRNSLAQFSKDIVDDLPPFFLTRYRLMTRQDAVQEIHFPTSRERLKQARRRLVYDELFLFQLKLQAYKMTNRVAANGGQASLSIDHVKDFINTLPFELTEAQKKVTKEILDDLHGPYHMNRLLQGDVGSGKTVVAAIALFAVASSGYQGALMVPTEILAEQHTESLKAMFKPFSIQIDLLTSSVKGKRRQEILEKIRTGQTGIVIGTHALIQEKVEFNHLRLVVTDEQHRFGVEQRRLLKEKGKEADVLFMTATPIPRTLAISVFGDMDVSTIDQLPSGRKKIKTYWVKTDMLPRILAFIQKELSTGRQAYIITPLIEESEQLDVQNAIDVHAQLQQYFHSYTVGLMHGKLTAQEKENVMTAFKENQSQILVSTTVVEVGVNVPNASLMVIYDAERFGLSQLHQLRGRVGRGAYQSYCILISEAKSQESQERMRMMCETTDGFELAEFDLKLRGPGDFFGKKQSGLPEFRLADLAHDYRTLAVARQDAADLLRKKEFWKEDIFLSLRRYLKDSGVLEGERLD